MFISSFSLSAVLSVCCLDYAFRLHCGLYTGFAFFYFYPCVFMTEVEYRHSRVKSPGQGLSVGVSFDVLILGFSTSGRIVKYRVGVREYQNADKRVEICGPREVSSQ